VSDGWVQHEIALHIEESPYPTDRKQWRLRFVDDDDRVVLFYFWQGPPYPPDLLSFLATEACRSFGYAVPPGVAVAARNNNTPPMDAA
jgi:hypothetical protein